MYCKVKMAAHHLLNITYLAFLRKIFPVQYATYFEERVLFHQKTFWCSLDQFCFSAINPVFTAVYMVCCHVYANFLIESTVTQLSIFTFLSLTLIADGWTIFCPLNFWAHGVLTDTVSTKSSVPLINMYLVHHSQSKLDPSIIRPFTCMTTPAIKPAEKHYCVSSIEIVMTLGFGLGCWINFFCECFIFLFPLNSSSQCFYFVSMKHKFQIII